MAVTPWLWHEVLSGDQSPTAPPLLTCDRCGIAIPRAALTGLMGSRLAYSQGDSWQTNPVGEPVRCTAKPM